MDEKMDGWIKLRKNDYMNRIDMSDPANEQELEVQVLSKVLHHHIKDKIDEPKKLKLKQTKRQFLRLGVGVALRMNMRTNRPLTIRPACYTHGLQRGLKPGRLSYRNLSFFFLMVFK